MMFDTNLERGIIATMDFDEQSLRIYLSLLQPYHFSDTKCKKDFEALRAGAPVDVDIRDSLPDNHEYYAQVLKELHLKRMIHKSCNHLMKELEQGGQLDTVVPKIQKLQTATSLDVSHRGLSVTEIEAIQKHTRSFERLENSYNFRDFYDHAGSSKGQTEVIFGHPKHGKTVYAIYRCSGYLKQGYKGLYVTMEDTHIKVMEKFERQLGVGHPYKDDLFIADRSIGTKDLDDIARFLRYHKTVDNIDFACIDYIQRIPVKGLSANDEVQRVVEASNRITDLANELNLFILLLAQPHRIDKGRREYNMFPEVYDLHGSSAIEKDAFVATAIFRPNQVDTLCTFNADNVLLNVVSPTRENIHKNTIFARQRLNREAEKSTYWLQLIHSDNGLREPEYRNS